jgi:ribosomal protein S27AE
MYCPRCDSSNVASHEERKADMQAEVGRMSGRRRTTALLGPLIEKIAEFFGAEWTKNHCRKCGYTWR